MLNGNPGFINLLNNHRHELGELAEDILDDRSSEHAGHVCGMMLKVALVGQLDTDALVDIMEDKHQILPDCIDELHSFLAIIVAFLDVRLSPLPLLTSEADSVSLAC